MGGSWRGLRLAHLATAAQANERSLGDSEEVRRRLVRRQCLVHRGSAVEVRQPARREAEGAGKGENGG